MQGGTVTERFVATILFADIVDSTDMAARLGDGQWRRVLDAYYRVARRELKRFHGKEIDTAGDGVFASFDAPGQALQCARARHPGPVLADRPGLALTVGALLGILLALIREEC